MSQAALLKAVRDRVSNKVGLDEFSGCDVMPDPGMPPQLAGPEFIAVVGSKSSKFQTRAICETYEVRLVISMRSRGRPWSTWGNSIWLTAMENLEELSRRAVGVIHGAGTDGIQLINDASDLIGDDADKFQSGVPLVFDTELGPVPKSSAWWGKPDDNYAGISTTLVFRSAERWQAVDNIV